MRTKRIKKQHLFPYEWTLKDANFTNDKGTVFECFSSGGGSTMGWKLAGFDVIGCNDIDKKMMDVYKLNLNPKYAFTESIATLKERDDLPKEMYELDVLSGSPPCTPFSIAGFREKIWGKEKRFKEGQAIQVLDDLFFDFIDLAKKLQPKIVVAENVKGLLQGKAIKYLEQVYIELDRAGYRTSHYLLDLSKMGVPQKRERVFVIAVRKDIAKPFTKPKGMFDVELKLNLDFNEREIPLKKFLEVERKSDNTSYLPNRYGDIVVDVNKACPTIVVIHRYWVDENHVLSKNTLVKASTFPMDYKYILKNHLYITAMSVPPVAMAQIAKRLHEQILIKIK